MISCFPVAVNDCYIPPRSRLSSTDCAIAVAMALCLSDTVHGSAYLEIVSNLGTTCVNMFTKFLRAVFSAGVVRIDSDGDSIRIRGVVIESRDANDGVSALQDCALLY